MVCFVKKILQSYIKKNQRFKKNLRFLLEHFFPEIRLFLQTEMIKKRKSSSAKKSFDMRKERGSNLDWYVICLKICASWVQSLEVKIFIKKMKCSKIFFSIMTTMMRTKNLSLLVCLLQSFDELLTSQPTSCFAHELLFSVLNAGQPTSFSIEGLYTSIELHVEIML
jgi:hypothetical protein